MYYVDRWKNFVTLGRNRKLIRLGFMIICINFYVRFKDEERRCFRKFKIIYKLIFSFLIGVAIARRY